ncbi:uncharacterized protein ARMOST_14529 [Armillaria ostoyae]|uniref:Uncharacterized protein n=1 Tax=Armillaria ostoyae TaxID=47428 RepID=A0A284RQR7_ARMOS|nr:uncharacterized protein ARMOST_14529 [Armillaria ostoyae]
MTPSTIALLTFAVPLRGAIPCAAQERWPRVEIGLAPEKGKIIDFVPAKNINTYFSLHLRTGIAVQHPPDTYNALEYSARSIILFSGL